jgi:CheY-like chemotaxis protein
MAYRLLIIPGENEALRALQGQMADDVEVQVLDTANDALWEVRNAPPEAIVADIELPGMSGMDLAEILPNFGVSTKVVLWSREPNRQAAQQAASHGVYRFLSGPLSADDLHDALYDALGHPRGGPSTPAPEALPEVLPEPPSAPPLTPEPSTPAPAAEVTVPPRPQESERSRRMRAAMALVPEQERPRRERPAPPPTPPAAPPPAPEPPAPARRPVTRRQGPLVLTADHLTPIRSRMDSLLQDVGAQCIVLTDRNGMILTEVGVTAGLPTMILLPLLSTSFSTASQISQMLREEESTALYMHEGSHYDLYCFDVLQRFMLVIVFDKAASTAKIGSVWVYAKRAIRDMQENLA